MDASAIGQATRVHHSNDSSSGNPSYSFSYTVEAITHSIAEETVTSRENARHPQQAPIELSGETIPLVAFRYASTMQAACRYLVDKRRLSFTAAARLLGRSPKSVWASYQQAKPLPEEETFGAESINIPVDIFRGIRSPLEAIVCYLREQGLRNQQIASLLDLDPRTTSTAARRGGARQ